MSRRKILALLAGVLLVGAVAIFFAFREGTAVPVDDAPPNDHLRDTSLAMTDSLSDQDSEFIRALTARVSEKGPGPVPIGDPVVMSNLGKKVCLAMNSGTSYGDAPEVIAAVRNTGSIAPADVVWAATRVYCPQRGM